MRELLVHLHVPKCAGAAINEALDAIHRGRILGGPPHEAIAKLDALSVAERNATFDVVLGHHVWGIQDKFRCPFVCFSATRDPLERICSYYNYIHTRPDHALHQWFKRHLPDLDLAGDALIGAHVFFKAEWQNYFCTTYWGGGPVDATIFPEARRAVRKRMEDRRLVAGHLDHVVRFLRQRGILAGELPRHNVTDVAAYGDFRPAAAATLGASARAALTAWNALDYELLAMIEELNTSETAAAE